jgi:hypothetical protein
MGYGKYSFLAQYKVKGGPKMDNRSSGSKLSSIASAVIVIAFFLPWVRACNSELTGYDLATNSNGRVQDAWVYWLTLIAPIFCLILYKFAKNTNVASKMGIAVARLVAGIIGFFPLLNIWFNAQQKGGAMEILYGGWITVAGYLGIALSFFVDLFSPTDEHK